jgi:hypothetical protein
MAELEFGRAHVKAAIANRRARAARSGTPPSDGTTSKRQKEAGAQAGPVHKGAANSSPPVRQSQLKNGQRKATRSTREPPLSGEHADASPRREARVGASTPKSPAPARAEGSLSAFAARTRAPGGSSRRS